MKTRKLLLSFLLLTGITGFCSTIIISAGSSDFVFSQDDVTISFGDVINFQLASIHTALEVDKPTWDTNGITPLSGGFHVFGGGSVNVSNLTVGDHWYVCENHVGMGMKGVIRVSPSMGMNDYQLAKSFTVFPNPTTDFVNVKASDNTLNLPFSVIDEIGRKVFIGRLNDVTTSIDLSQLNSGLYFLQVGEEKKQIFKLIKK